LLGLGAIVPRLDGIEHLLECPETTSKPQIDFETLSANHILLGKPDIFAYSILIDIIRAVGRGGGGAMGVSTPCHKGPPNLRGRVKITLRMQEKGTSTT